MLSLSRETGGILKCVQTSNKKSTRKRQGDCDQRRYTIVYRSSQYWDSIRLIETKLLNDANVDHITCKNFWNPLSTYNGYHIDVHSLGSCYEIQLHTDSSLFVREFPLHHFLYKRFPSLPLSTFIRFFISYIILYASFNEETLVGQKNNERHC